jgi:hypothetical protein
MKPKVFAHGFYFGETFILFFSEQFFLQPIYELRCPLLPIKVMHSNFNEDILVRPFNTKELSSKNNKRNPTKCRGLPSNVMQIWQLGTFLSQKSFVV